MNGIAWMDATADQPDVKAIEVQVTAEIHAVFVHLIRNVSAVNLTLPSVCYSPWAERREMLTEAISDRVGYGAPLAALVAVLERSDCPMVQELREALAADYTHANAGDIAQLRAES